MKRHIKLTPEVLKRIIREEKEKINLQAKKIASARRNKRLNEVRKELKAFIQLKREQKALIERIRKIQNRSRRIKKKIEEV